MNDYSITYTRNFEEMDLNELKEMRKRFDLTKVHSQYQDIAYLCRMIDLLLEKVEQLENE